MCLDFNVSTLVRDNGYANLWPYRDHGRDLVQSLYLSGVKSDQLHIGHNQSWAIIERGGRTTRLEAQTEREALRQARTRSARGAVAVLRKVAQGDRELWEHFAIVQDLPASVAMSIPDRDLLDPSGVLITKGRGVNVRNLTNLLSTSLREIDRRYAKPAIERALNRMDIDFTSASPTRVAEAMREARGMLRQLVGNDNMVRSWSTKMRVIVEDTARKTKRVVGNFLPSVQQSLTLPDKEAINQLVTQQGWFLRDSMGKRSDLLTARGRQIVQDGLRNGFGRMEITRQLETQLPDLWKGTARTYARTTAAVAVSRARSWSEVVSYQEANIEYLQVQAVLDERTTDVCRAMDGTLILVRDAAAHLLKASSVRKPEDIYDEAPFMKTVRNDKGERFIQTRTGATVARIDRSGIGRPNDRGESARMMNQKALTKAKVTVPPYHHLCRTFTTPVLESVQVPSRGFARASSEFGRNKELLDSPGAQAPIRVAERATKRFPASIANQKAPLDEVVWPGFTSPPRRLANAVERGETPFVAERFVYDPRSPDSLRASGNDWSKGRKNTNTLEALSSSPSIYPRGNDGVSNLVMKDSVHKSETIGAAISNENCLGKDTILSMTNTTGGLPRYVRINGRNAPGWARSSARLRRLISEGADPKEIKEQADKLIKIGKEKGWLKTGRSMDSVTIAADSRKPI